MRNKTIALILVLFFGYAGIHQFYLGNTKKGVLYLVFFWTGIPFVFAIIDFFRILTENQISFNEKYNNSNLEKLIGLKQYLSEYPQASENTLQLLERDLPKMEQDIAHKQVQEFMYSQIKKSGLNEKEQIKSFLKTGLKTELQNFEGVVNQMYFSTIVEGFLEDDALAPEEIKKLVIKANELNIERFNSEESIRKEYAYYIKNWEFDNGIFEEVISDFILSKNETCIYRNEQVELSERKELSNRINYSGPRARIKITKGLSYNLGAYNYSTNNVLKEISKGIGLVNVTTKRILFKSEEQNKVIRLSEIVDIEPYSDGIIIFRSSGNPCLFRTEKGLELYQAVNGAIRNI